MNNSSRRSFLQAVGLSAAAAAAGLPASAMADNQKVIQGFDEIETDADASKDWQSISDRKIRVGIVGNGLCRFGAAFGFQDHPNVEVVAVSDLFPDRCAEMAKRCRCKKTYPSLEELVKDDTIEAVFVATDAPSHFRHCLEVMKHGKHVCTAVPAVFGSVEDAEELLVSVKTSGLKYMMFETSCFRADNWAMRQVYKAGGFGRLVYSEGEYYHYNGEKLLPSYKGWRNGLPPLWYPTHSTAYYVGVTDEAYTSVSCMGFKSGSKYYLPGATEFGNEITDEVALFRTTEGGLSRMLKARTTYKKGGETGRVFGEKGWMAGTQYQGRMKKLPNIARPPLPPGVPAGGHGGSHGRLTDEFITSILTDRKPLVDVCQALNMTVPGIIAHQSALKDGETLQVPIYKV